MKVGRRPRVMLRRIPGALGMGLATALVGHAVIYGNGHAMGGDYHGVLVNLAIAGSVALLGAFAVLIAAGAQFVADGSILARRIATLLPTLPTLLAATVTWYGVGEAIEPHHAAASLVAVALVMILATALVLFAARALIAWLASAVVAILRLAFVARRPATAIRRRSIPPAIPAAPSLRRRFARPPPTIARAF